jgi:hypothetical protein
MPHSLARLPILQLRRQEDPDNLKIVLQKDEDPDARCWAQANLP